MKTILGISAGFHDAAVSVVNNVGDILFAGHSERYSKKKHDEHLSSGLMQEALSYGPPSIVSYYERPWLKKTRQLYAGQYADAFDFSDITIKKYLATHCPTVAFKPLTQFVHQPHHLSHAAASFQTSPFQRATVVVIDAIGEWDTISIYGAEYDRYGNAKYVKLWGQRYPHSIGLFYSAMTKRVGLRPLDEEYILMGMAGYGSSRYMSRMRHELVSDAKTATMRINLHCGVDDEYLESTADTEEQNNFDIAASTQFVTEQLVNEIMLKAAQFRWSRNLVYTGGVALNCSANRHLGNWFDNIWVMPNPGDAGSSLGAAALAYKKRLNWVSPYLGTDIPGDYPVQQLVEKLLTDKIVGVASGKAEFGPRALGNRSLLADPRGDEIKDKVNAIKRRQKFRPFAPVILEEYAHLYFAMPKGWDESPYMQVTAKCLRPDKFPAIIHVDGTSRVQTVSRTCTSGIRQLLEEWKTQTGCPMLLNTSLNIRGEPMLNDRADADRFQELYGVTVLS
jgi:carbamoyltransferase